MKDILLYGKRKGDKYEDLIAQCPSVEYAERLKPIARERWGFIEFRIAIIDMTTPPRFRGNRKHLRRTKMKLEHSNQVAIAQAVLRAYHIHPSVSNSFRKGSKKHRLFYSERGNSSFPAVLYWLDNKPEFVKIANDYAEKTGNLVFHAILTPTEFGDLLDILSIPSDTEDVQAFLEEAQEGIFRSYCYNLSTGEAECGSIKVRPIMGGLERIA